VDEAVKAAIKTGIPQKVGHIRFEMKSGVLFITLLSGRKLAYIKPRIEPNQFGGESITYMGTDAQKHWSRIESYGPKIVENIVQAVCRDLLAETMKRIENSEFRIQNSELKNPGCRIVAHVHDEVIIEAPVDTPVGTITDIMGQTPEWIRGLELRGDGTEMEWYRKD
jgi:DNA polymerase